MAPNKWTLGKWKAKCHIPIMHELSGGEIGMRNTWHGDFHVSSWTKKGVLHLDQKDFGGERMRKGREKIEKKENEEGSPIFYWYSNVRTARVRRLRRELDYAPRGRGSLLLWLVLV